MINLNYFNFCAMGIMLVLVITAMVRRMLRGRRNRYFWNLLLVVTCSALFEILVVILDNTYEASVTQKYIVHCCYLIMHSLSVPVYVLYLACLTDSLYRLRDNPAVQLVLAAPFAGLMICIVLSPVYHIIFYFDSLNRYTKGPCYFLLYAAAAFYIALAVIHVLRQRRLFAKGQMFVVLAILPVVAAALWVQVTYPMIRVEMFVWALGLLFLLLMVQKPEERTDPVTGFGKQGAYVTDIGQALGNEKPVHIILINILNYKALRDILGYQSMQSLLGIVSEKIMRLCREQLPKADPYYLEGGRFCLVTGKENFHRTDGAARALNGMLKDVIYLQDMDINLQVNLCILHCPEDLCDFQSIYAFSNEFEEYEKTGKVLYAEEILKDGRYIIKDLEGIIDNAVHNQGLTVYYQPIYSVEKGKYVSAEALIRLNDEEYGHISPELFIPVAEKNGVIHQIGIYVLEEVCKFIASREFQELGMEYIEVNLSVAQCMRNNLASEIIAILHKYQVRPDQINLEITETAIADSQNIMSENIRLLKEEGLSFSLDDFGTGYSNIRRVATLPLNIVKLDKTFTDLETNPKLDIVVRNTVRMVKDMDMKIVVEGIETENMVRYFSDLKCEYIQGYYFSKPLSREEFVCFVGQANKG